MRWRDTTIFHLFLHLTGCNWSEDHQGVQAQAVEHFRHWLQTEHGDRNSGRTAKQMANAPLDAMFIWCTDDLYYPRHLAGYLGRRDLLIKPLNVLKHSECFLSSLRHVVLDHAAYEHMSRRQWDLWQEVKYLLDLKNRQA